MLLDKIQYKNYQNNFNKVITFEGLLTEQKINTHDFKKFLGYYYTLQLSDKTEMNQFTLEILDYIELALNKTRFTDVQKTYLLLHMSGYKTIEIASRFNISQVAVRKSLTKATEKIINEIIKMKEMDSKI